MSPNELDTLRAEVESVGDPHLLPLDLSYASLDRLEDYFRLVLEGDTPVDVGLPSRIARYVGDTLIQNAGGRWEGEGDRARVGRIPRLRTGEYDPWGPVLHFERLRIPGILLDTTVAWDIAARRRALKMALADVDAAARSLREEVRVLTGADPGSLETGAPTELRALQMALRVLVVESRPREERRRVREHAVIYLGTLVQRALGGGTWTVCDRPRYEEFGEFCMEGWPPWRAIRHASPGHPPGSLGREVKGAIEVRRARRPAARQPEVKRKSTPQRSKVANRSGTGGLWLALVPPGKVLPLDQLEVRLATLPRVVVRRRQTYLIVETQVATGRKLSINVGLNAEPHVKEESRELAELEGAHRSDRELFASAEARYELTWDPRLAEESYNTVVRIAEVLERCCQVVIYDPGASRFV